MGVKALRKDRGKIKYKSTDKKLTLTKKYVNIYRLMFLSA